MKLQKMLPKILITIILFNNISLTSYSVGLSEDSRYEVYNDDSITIKDILESQETNFTINGKTIVNHLSSARNIQGNLWEYSDKHFKFNSGVQPDNPVSGGVIWDVVDIKPDTIYSFIYNASEVTCDDMIILNPDNGFYIPDILSAGLPYNAKVNEGINIITFKTKSTLSSDENKLKISVPNSNPTGVISIHEDIMLLEGDWRNKKIPEYFKGIKSSFENNLVTQDIVDNDGEKLSNLNKYKAEVKISGKNIFKKDNLTYDKLLVNATILEQNASYVVSDFIKVKPNTNYTLTNVNAWYSYQYDKNKKPIETDRLQNSFITDSTCEYIRLSFLKDYIDLIQVEESDIGTSYEPYSEMVDAFYLNSPLLIGDTIEVKNGQAYHVHRSKNILLNGSENWEKNNIDPNFSLYNYYLIIENKKPNGYIYNNKLTNLTTEEWVNHSKVGIINGAGAIGICYTESSLETFKNWLSQNPVEIVYELENPIYEPIKANLSIQLFEGTTYIDNNSDVPTNMKVVIDRALNRAVESIKTAKANPTMSNISQARYWSNLLYDSATKDIVQSEINNITQIQDLEIENKTVTANLDVYIKSANTLSMSLNTNSITFEDYSGIEDKEMLNAVEISISSSLPYSLNAYLESPIQNSDGSSTIESSALNIKESNQTNYQAFQDINEKIVLNDNADANNDWTTHNIDIKLAKDNAHKPDVYKATIKFEAVQK